jgi:hypothetical protein
MDCVIVECVVIIVFNGLCCIGVCCNVLYCNGFIAFAVRVFLGLRSVFSFFTIMWQKLASFVMASCCFVVGLLS